MMQFAHEVVDRRRSIQGAINEVRHPSVLDVLADEDFGFLVKPSSNRRRTTHRFSLALARLTHAAARAKGFDRQIVDAALRLDALLPPKTPAASVKRCYATPTRSHAAAAMPAADALRSRG
ncbi:MAG: hypothetical protein R2843_16370 [Thermomicrobiales bacterium]